MWKVKDRINCVKPYSWEENGDYFELYWVGHEEEGYTYWSVKHTLEAICDKLILKVDEREDEDHEGMIYNEYTKTWGWL